MRLGSFKRNLKKEFNQNYIDNKRTKKKSIWIKLIPVYCVAAVILIFGLVLGIDAIATSNHNNRFNDRALLYENASYHELETITNKEFEEYASYQKRESIIDQLQDINFGGFAAKNGVAMEDANPTMNEDTYNPSNNGPKSTDTQYDTNNQEEGVIEADIAKFDGKYCYYVSSNYLYIYRLDGTKVIDKKVQFTSKFWYSRDNKLQIYKNRIVISTYSTIMVFTFENEELKEEMTIVSNGEIETRLVNNFLYVGGFRNYNSLEKDELPEKLYYDMLSSCSRIYSIYKINLDTLESKEVNLAAGYSVVVYMSDTHFVLSSYSFITNTKNITLNSVFDLDLKPIGVFACDGEILDQYSIDVYDNTLRVVSTANKKGKICNMLTIFDINKHVLLSCLDEGIGLPQERVKSATFTNEKCYIVTFLQTDPLYEIDITDPKNPIIKNALKVEGYSSYLKTFLINGKEYVFGAGYINGSYKYSIYKNDENLTQIGEDYLLTQITGPYLINGKEYYDYSYASDCSIDPHAMFFYLKDDILYFGAPFNEGEYVLYKIDVTKDEPIVVQIEIETTTETRLFLYEGKIYLPQINKLIVEDFVE